MYVLETNSLRSLCLSNWHCLRRLGIDNPRLVRLDLLPTTEVSA